MGTLYIVATPIGNLEDITLRALRILKEACFILCEDTRVTKKLLNHFEIQIPTLSYHQHSNPEKMEYIFRLLLEGKNLVLVTDAGTPGISDPGNELVSFLSQKNQDVKIVPIPGVSAVAAIASISGFPMDKFMFFGYPPHKNKRKKFFQEVAQSRYPVILYESPYRIVKTLTELAEVSSNASIVVGRELTKKFETVYRGTIDQALEKVQKDMVKGEFVLVIQNQ